VDRNGIDHKKLNQLVEQLSPADNLYHAALDIAARLHDGRQNPKELLLAVIEEIDRRFLR